MVVVVGILAIIVLATAGLTLGQRPLEVSAAASQFGTALDATRIAASSYGDGATLFVEPRTGAAGFQATIYAHRPGHPKLFLIRGYPLVISNAAIAESTTLDAPAFAVIIHGSGNVGARAAYRVGDSATTPEIPCPVSGAFAFVFSIGTERTTRYLPCSIELSQTGPLKIDPPPTPGPTPAPLATQCAIDANCLLGTPAPAASPTCPPGLLSTNGGQGCNAPFAVTPATITLSVPGATSTYAVSANGIASKGNVLAPMTVRFSGCAGIVTAVAGTSVETGGGAQSPLTITAQTPGSCMLTATNQFNETQTIAVTVYGALTVNPTSLTFASATSPSQTTTANEPNYRGVITADASNCAGYATVSPSSQITDGSFDAVFSVQPVAATRQCKILFSDDHGGNVMEAATVQQPGVLCRDGNYVGFGTPCPNPTLKNVALCSTNPLIGSPAPGGGAYTNDGNACTPWSIVTDYSGVTTTSCTHTSFGTSTTNDVQVGTSIVNLAYNSVIDSLAPTFTVIYSTNGFCAQFITPSSGSIQQSYYPYET